MTATISRNSTCNIKTFSVTVIKSDMIDAEQVTADKEALIITFQGNDSEQYVTTNITLPGTGINGSIISWSSNNTEIISIFANSTTTGSDGSSYVDTYVGLITLPKTGDLTSVTLTAMISKNNAQEIKYFTLSVPSIEYIYAHAGTYQ